MADVSSRSLLFYAAWPLGYHNIEAQRKAVRFASDGYDVVYVSGIGTRNPRLSSVSKLLDRVTRKITPRPPPAEARVPGLRTASLAIFPPRQLRLLRRLNDRWVRRQMDAMVPDWSTAVAWIRWPSQEVVSALRRLEPALIVYESVDANHLSPGITGIWSEVFEHAERELVSLADLVVVPGEALAERYRPWGPTVAILPHGVDLGAWRRDRTRSPSLTLGFVGSLDYRLDHDVLETIAEARPNWSIRLVGPIQEGFDRSRFAHLRNVSIEPPVPATVVPELNSTFDIGLLAYRDHPHYRHMAPLKALELLASGAPVVARENPALAALDHPISFADTPAAFLSQIEAASRDDTPELADRRRRFAEQHSWEARLDDMTRLVADALRSKETLK